MHVSSKEWLVLHCNEKCIKGIDSNKCSQRVKGNSKWEVLKLQVFDIKKNNAPEQWHSLMYKSCKNVIHCVYFNYGCYF